MRRIPLDKRIQPSERHTDGACIVCKRRHIHTDDCVMLDLRPSRNARRVLQDERDLNDVCTECREPFAHQIDCAVFLQRRPLT
jgi:hypothetical protein